MLNSKLKAALEKHIKLTQNIDDDIVTVLAAGKVLIYNYSKSDFEVIEFLPDNDFTIIAYGPLVSKLEPHDEVIKLTQYQEQFIYENRLRNLELRAEDHERKLNRYYIQFNLI